MVKYFNIMELLDGVLYFDMDKLYFFIIVKCLSFIAKSYFECENKNWSSKLFTSFCAKHNVMIILRGVPGSGKSTVAKKLKSFFRYKDAVICSADDFRYTQNIIFILYELQNCLGSQRHSPPKVIIITFTVLHMH